MWLLIHVFYSKLFLCLNLLYTTFHFVDIVYFMIFYVRLWFYVSIFLFIFVLAQSADLSSTINEKGCLLAGEEWLEKNLIVVAGVAVGIAFLQVRTLFFFLFLFFFRAFGYFPLLPLISSVNHNCNIIYNVFTFQILGICFAQNLRADIFAQMAKW